MRNYINQYNELLDFQQRIYEKQDNHDIRNLINDADLDEKTFLSPFTIVENNFVSVTSDHLNRHDGGDNTDRREKINQQTKELL